MKTKQQIPIAIALSVMAIGSANAAISLVSSTQGTSNSFTFAANGQSKLVVVVTGEHHFGNTNGTISGVTYDGVALTQAVKYTPVDSSNITVTGVWYLDNPTTSTGAIVVTKGGNNFVYSAFSLSGAAAGVGNIATSVVGGAASKSVNLTTTGADSYVLGVHTMGGDHTNGGTTGNTADTNNVNSVSPLTEFSALSVGSNWAGQVAGGGSVAAAGTGTYSFTGGSTLGTRTYAVEFLAVPEPSSAALLGLAGLALIIRRRK